MERHIAIPCDLRQFLDNIPTVICHMYLDNKTAENLDKTEATYVIYLKNLELIHFWRIFISIKTQ